MNNEDLLKLLEEASEDQLGEIVTGMLYAGVKAATDQGVQPLKAIRGVVALYFQEYLGSAVWKELGVPQSTAERWRKDIREVLAEAPEIQEGPSDEMMMRYLQLRIQKIAKDQKKAAA